MPVLILKKRNCRTLRKHKESDLIRDCIEYLRFSGYIPIRVNSGLVVLRDGSRTRVVRLAEKGTPDIVACGPDGRFIAIECKNGSSKLTEHQKVFLDKIKKNNGIAVVINCLDDLIEVVNYRYGGKIPGNRKAS